MAAMTGTDGNRRGPAGGYQCCKHCAEDDVHIIPDEGHEVPCQTCDNPSGLLQERVIEAEAKIAAVRALHHRDSTGDWCDHCWTGPDTHGNGPSPEWPCATIRALDGDGQ